MDPETETPETCRNGWCGYRWKPWEHAHCNGTGVAFYILGFLGALGYYWTTATSLWGGVVGFFKAIFWPAFLVYAAMKFLGA